MATAPFLDTVHRAVMGQLSIPGLTTLVDQEPGQVRVVVFHTGGGRIKFAVVVELRMHELDSKLWVNIRDTLDDKPDADLYLNFETDAPNFLLTLPQLETFSETATRVMVKAQKAHDAKVEAEKANSVVSPVGTEPAAKDISTRPQCLSEKNEPEASKVHEGTHAVSDDNGSEDTPRCGACDSPFTEDLSDTYCNQCFRSF